MRHFQASAVERRRFFDSIVESHPMEAGWASEAIFFLIVEETEPVEAVLHAQVDISADGINWVAEGTSFPEIKQPGTYFVRVRHFGNWLRVSGTISGPQGGRMKLSVHLHLKD